MVLFPSASEEVKEGIYVTCLAVFLKVSLPVCDKFDILPDLDVIDQSSTGIALSHAPHPKWLELWAVLALGNIRLENK